MKGGVREASKLGKALRWEERGWPDWAILQPIAEAALQAALPLKAGGNSARSAKGVAKGKQSPIYTQTMRPRSGSAYKAGSRRGGAHAIKEERHRDLLSRPLG